MVRPLLNRRTAKRQVILIADEFLTRAERLWVDALGARRRVQNRGTVDPSTGRTRMEHLRRTGIGDSVWPRVQDALNSGVEQNELIAALDAVTSEAGEQLAATLQRRAPQMLRDHRAVQRGMHRRMRAMWGPAFDAFYELYVCVEELGSDLQQLHGADSDPLVEALLALHARACLVLAEIHALMIQGFPLGAWARTRSLHETAILATLLADHGREPETSDLGERFIRHAVVDQARDLLELAVRGGVDVDDAELARVRDERDRVVSRYGRMFAKDYGWARALFPSLGQKERLTFERLEELAETGLDRLDYRLGGHHIHSSAWTVVLNLVPRGGRVYRLTGPTNVGFGEPASVALASMLACTSATIYGVTPLPEPMHVVGLRALRTLGTRAVQLFAEGQTLVDDREAQVQAQEAGTSTYFEVPD